MSRILVTGGTGFIGRWVVKGLLDRGHQVRVFDMSPNPAALDDISPGLSAGVDCVAGDIADGSVRQAAKGCEGIVHLAGVLTVEAAHDPIRAAQINLIGSLHAFEAAREFGIKRIAYVSSSAVFGPDDAHQPKPMSHYGAQKLAIEGSARAYLLDQGIPSVGFRPYIVYGPGQSSGIAAGPSIALANALQGVPTEIQFSGRVGFVHVYDVAALMVEAVCSPMVGAEAYTLCGETTEMEAFCDVLRSRIPGAEIAIDGEPLRIPADLASSPLPPVLSALPVTGVEAGIDATLQFYRERQA